MIEKVNYGYCENLILLLWCQLLLMIFNSLREGAQTVEKNHRPSILSIIKIGNDTTSVSFVYFYSY